MQKILGTLILTLFIAFGSALAQTDYCFANDGLKGATNILFVLTGNKISEGEFQPPGDEGTSGEIYHFTGTKAGNILKIKFDHTVPEGLQKVKKIAWVLGKKSLKVPTYGKNYETNKWSIYPAIYEKCVVYGEQQ